MRRAGWTLHEMIISLAITGIIVALAAGAAMRQLRFFRGIGEVVAVRTQVGQAALIAANVLRDVALADDIHFASDSAIEASITVGITVSCAEGTGRFEIPAASATGHTLSAFAVSPEPGDVALALAHDSAGTSWLAMRIASVSDASSCALFPASAGGLSLATIEPFVLPAGTPMRILRRTRLSLYRASDDLWYLGLKEWNGTLGRFNTIQPVAGPLLPYSADPARTGFAFEYRDQAGVRLESPADAARIALITTRARGRSKRPSLVAGMASAAAPFAEDSVTLSVAIRR